MTSIDQRRIVAAKRDGKTLTSADIEGFVEGYVEGSVSDALAAAFLMAVVTRGFDAGETLALTRAFIDSGTTMSLAGVGRHTVDKHSTGGVADGVTLVFAPLAAALDLAVAKLSGRGLGHTGGTLDKLESIPGLRTDLAPEAIERQLETVGCVVAAQSPHLVPADGAWYALRDATATVPSVPLIAASVMAKKLAVETDLIVLDIKAGSGAFMKGPQEAEVLADACLGLARGMDRHAVAAVTDMSQPLGDAVGNAIDVAEAIGVMRGERGGRLRELSLHLVAHALALAGGIDPPEARRIAEARLDDGSALDRFREMVQAQGGDPRVADDPGSVLPVAPVIVSLRVERAGTVAAMDAEEIGHAAGGLGAGRTQKGAAIDPSVGVVLRAKIGDRLEPGAVIGEVHARTTPAADEAARRVQGALTLTDGPVAAPELVYAWRSTETSEGRT